MTAPAQQKARGLTRWRPRKWEPIHEQIVIMSCLGRSGAQIAEAFGYTPQHISNILNTPEAALVKRRVLESLRKGADASFEDRVSDLADQSVRRIQQVLFDDELMEKSPFAVVDRGLAVLKGIGKFKSQEGSRVNDFRGAIILAPDDARMLSEGARMADQAKLLNPVETTAVTSDSDK